MPSLACVSNKELLNLVNIGGRGCRCTSHDFTPWSFVQQSSIDRSRFITPTDALSLLNSDASSTYESDDDSDASFSSASSSFVSCSENSYYSEGNNEVVNKLGTRHGNRLVDCKALTSTVEQVTACKLYYKDQLDQEFDSFLTFCEEKLNDIGKVEQPMFHTQDTASVRDIIDI